MPTAGSQILSGDSALGVIDELAILGETAGTYIIVVYSPPGGIAGGATKVFGPG